jgi:hypothetical protein
VPEPTRSFGLSRFRAALADRLARMHARRIRSPCSIAITALRYPRSYMASERFVANQVAMQESP